jgi:hypothetical protein
MDLFAVAQSVSHSLSALPLDENTVSVLAMLAGVIGGWMLTGLHQQMKAKRVKTSRKQPPTLRKPE